MKLMGIGDEGGSMIDDQVRVTRELGWRSIELRAVEARGCPKGNVQDIPDAAFDMLAGQLAEAGVHAYCLGSAIMNWSKRVQDPFALTLDEVRQVIPRMQRMGTKFVRIMSFKPGDDEHRIPAEVFRRVRDVTRLFLDEGIQPVHENCMNYGGMSWQHALELLDKVSGLKWVFDTANPVFNPDRSKPKPWPRQDAWEFWENVREHVAHIHVKDAVWNETRMDADYCWPGDGHGRVREVLADAVRRRYTGGVSIEPHMVVVFHGNNTKAEDRQNRLRQNFLEYGRRLERLIEEAKSQWARSQPSS